MHPFISRLGPVDILQRNRPAKVGGGSLPGLEMKSHAGARQIEPVYLAGQRLLHAHDPAIDKSQQTKLVDPPDQVVGIIGRKDFKLATGAVVAQRRDFQVSAHRVYPTDDSLLIIDKRLRRKLPSRTARPSPALRHGVRMGKVAAQKYIVGMGLETLVGKFSFTSHHVAQVK